MSNKLADKVAVITGGASGIGRGIARLFVEEGARVVIGDLNETLLAEAALQFGEQCAVLKTDVADEANIEALVALALARFGGLDIGVNCAGASFPGKLVETSLETWNRGLTVNLTGGFLAMKHEARAMIASGRGGVIIAVTSVTSRVAATGLGSYGVAKAGLQHLIRLASIELASKRIRVVGLGPGLIETPMTEALMSNPEMVSDYLRSVPLNRAGKVDDTAKAALFLASDDASYITGDILMVDGGQQGVGWSRGGRR